MSWEEARGLARRGFTIGAHSRKHPILPRETRSAAVADIEQCIAKVTGETGTPCQTFAFPNGNYTAELAYEALRCGVRTVMTTEPTWADSTFPLWRLPRVQLFPGFDRSRMELKLTVAATGRCVLVNPDGSGKAYCKINRLGRREARLPAEGNADDAAP